MPDLGKLKALFLEEGYTKIYYPEARDNSLEFEKLSDFPIVYSKNCKILFDIILQKL